LSPLITTDDLAPAELTDFLKMNFRIVDQHAKQIATGRDLSEIRRKLGLAARATFAELPPHPQFHRDGLKRWEFGDLPQRIEIKRHGVTLGAYPAIVDQGEAIGLRLFDSPDAARAAHLHRICQTIEILLAEPDLTLGRVADEARPDVIVSVVDAANLDRHLLLAKEWFPHIPPAHT